MVLENAVQVNNIVERVQRVFIERLYGMQTFFCQEQLKHLGQYSHQRRK